MSKQTRKRKFEEVDSLLEVEPTSVGRSGRLILKKEDGKHIALADARGKLTVLGKRYFEKSGKEYNAAFDKEVPLVRKGAKEYVKMRSGELRLARTYQDGDHRYTRIGKNYFDARGTTQEFLLSIPVKIEGTGKGGRKYERFGSLPSTALGIGPLKIPIAATMAEKEEQAKQQILDAMNEGSILEVSSEKYSYHAEGAWAISMLETRVADDGERTVEAVLNRPLQAGTPLSYSHLHNPWAFAPEAFEETEGDCVVHQLSRQLNLDEECIRDEFTEIQESEEIEIYEGKHWSTKGPTGRMLLEWCKRKGHTCHIMWGNNLIQTFTGKNPAVCCAIWANHLYMFKDKQGISHMTPRVPRASDEILGKPARETDEELEDMLEYRQVAPGRFWCHRDCMGQVLRDMLASGRVPVCKMKNFVEIRQIELRDKKETTVVRALPGTWMELQDFAARLALHKGKAIVRYNGEGLAAFMLKNIIALMRPERTSLPQMQGSCSICGTRGLLERDHRVPLSMGGGKDIDLLCSMCHQDKNRTEGAAHAHSRGQSLNPLMSYFSKQTYADFMASHPKQVVCRMHKPQQAGLLIDVKKCRRSALTSGWELPVFCALDQIRPFEMNDLDADFFYLDRAPGTLISTLPWTGSRWYHKCAVLYLLETRRINYADVKYSFKASGHLDAQAFEEPFRIIQYIWAHCEFDASKEGINAAIGLMGSRENWLYRCTMSTHPDDALMLGGKVAQKQVGELHQWVSRTKVLGNSSMYPIYHFTLDWERTMLARITDAAIQLGTPRKSICEYRTDSVFIDKCCSKLSNFLSNMTASDIGCRGGKLLTVEKVQPLEPPAGFDPTSSCPEPEITYDWNVVTEQSQDIIQKARDIVIDKGESLLLLGPPGVGKSTLVKQLVEELKEKGHNVRTTALTHVASRVIEGQTIQSFLYRYVLNGSFQGWLILDEISVLTISVLNFISTLLNGNVRFILLGDFFQLPAICDYWAGKEVQNNGFQNSRLLWELCEGNVIHLTKCRRSAGTHIFHFVTGLYPNGQLGTLPLCDQVSLARRVFPLQRGIARWNLCISHAKRKTLNKICYDFFAKGERLNVQLSDELVNQIFVGCALLGNSTDRRITNGCFYEVMSFTDKLVTIRDLENLESVDVPVENMKALRLGWAITYAAVQGRTLKERTRLWCTDHPRFTTRHLAMAIGRVTRPDDLDIA